MALCIESPEADRLAQELAHRTGETLEEVVVTALRERLARAPGGRPLPEAAGSAERGSCKDRTQEMRWLADNRRRYPGKWLAVEGETLLAVGASLKDVLAEARAKGVQVPLVSWSTAEQLPFGGW